MPSHKATLPLARRGFLLGASALGLAACAPAGLRNPLWGPPEDTAAPKLPPAPAWWQAFRDTELDQLIQAGHARNLDLAQAIEAIRVAQAGLGAQSAADLPRIGASANANRGDSEGAGTITETSAAGLNVAWVLDIFGANRNAKAAAAARVDASTANARATRLLIEGAIASAYLELRYHQASLALTRRSLTSRRKSLDLTKTRFEIGDAARIDVVQAEQLVAEGEAQLPQYEIGQDRAVARLASLTAQPSSALRGRLLKSARQPVPQVRAAAGVPADLVRARPDVQMQEALFAAATAEIGVARAAFWPSVQLTGSIMPVNIGGGGNLKPWGLGPSIDLPIFRGGANIANLRGAEARAAQAHAAWQSAIFAAVEEVETALAATSRDARVVGSQQKLAATTREAVDLTQQNFSLGEGNFMAVLDAERSYLGAQQAVAAAQMARGLNFVSLALASAGAVGAAPSAPR